MGIQSARVAFPRMDMVTLIAFDYDGTLATNGTVASQTTVSLRALFASGRKLILATGRQLHELLGIFPEVALFGWVIAENGAVIYETATRKSELVGHPPPSEFVRILANDGVKPLSTGKVVVATHSCHAARLRSLIHQMHLQHEVILNKDAAMVLPKGVNKGSALQSLLRRLGIDKEEVLCAGDGENDVDLFNASGLRVAVANAVPELKAQAHWVTRASEGLGVQELSETLVSSGYEST